MDAQYDVGLVVLSLMIAVAAAYTALDLASRVSATPGRSPWGWMLAGASIMGLGIWSMHFVGMIAFELPIPMAFDVWITLTSLVLAILASGISLYLSARRRLPLKLVLVGGVFMGLGISAMHYVGVLAMRMQPAIAYDARLVVLSIVIAVGASSLALWLCFTLKDDDGAGAPRKKLLGALVMGLAIAGMHYTGMSAANVLPGSICRVASETSFTGLLASDLAYVVAAFVGVVLSMTIVTAHYDSRLVRQAARSLRDMDQANRALRDDARHRATAEGELRRLERFVRSTMDSLQEHICVVDSQGYILAVNKAWRQFAANNGAIPDMVSEGGNYFHVCQQATEPDGQVAADFASKLAEVLEGRLNNASVEYPCHGPEVHRWFLARITRFEGEGPECAVVLHEDITAGKLSSIAIAAEAERRRILFEKAVDGIVLLDDQRRVVEANESFCRMLGRNLDTVKALHPWDWDVKYPTRDDFLEQWPDLPTESGIVLTQMRRLDGTRFAAEVTHSLVQWGDAPMLLCIVRDITERERVQQLIADNETRYATVLDTLVDGVIIIDSAGTIADINLAAQRIFDYQASQLIGTNITRLMPEPHRDRHDSYLRSYLETGVARIIGTGRELVGCRRDGSQFPMDLAISEMRLKGRRMFAGVVRDVTERRSQQDKVLRLTRMRAVSGAVSALLPRITSAEDLMRDVSRIVVDQGGCLLAWFGLREGDRFRVASIYGTADAQVVVESGLSAMPVHDVPISPSVLDRRISVQRAAANDDGTGMESMTAALGRRAGAASTIEIPLMRGSEVIGCLGLAASEPDFFDEDQVTLLRDVSGDVSHGFEFISKTEALKYLASYDSLTRLANRELFLQSTGTAIGQSRIDGGRLAIILLDLENFKGINDTVGHSGGDALLRQFAARVTELAPAPGQGSRIGGDRFGVWIPIADEQCDAAATAQDILLRPLAAPFELHGATFRLRHRAGIALFPQDGDQAERLFRSAEAALKKAKIENERLLFATVGLSDSFRERMDFENRLHRAVENREFTLEYQPKVRISDGRIEGCEALLRWTPAGARPLSPAYFVPFLEQSGLIAEVGLWAIQQALKDLACWRSAGFDTRVAVNVSPVQLRQPDFVASVEQVLQGPVSDPGIDLEVTESMLMTDVDSTIGKLTQLRDGHVRISIDDFGTGYSSLSYLAQLPLDSLKIDRSFVIRMNASSATLAIVNGVISLAHALGLKVIAEGVDTDEQLVALRDMRCDQIQGWLFSKAIDAGKFEALLREDRRLSLPTSTP